MVILKVFKFITGVKIVSTGFAGIGKDSYWNMRLTPDAFVAMTEHAAKWAAKINPKITVATIGGGVDLERFNPNGETVNLDLNKPVILCVSALVSYKRVDLAIQAVSKLKAGSLLVIGDGYNKKYLQELGRRLLGEKRFKILEIPYSEIEKYYRAADVFTLASESSEAFGIVYIEAMACGKPIVAPDDEVRKEIIGDGGVLVDVENTSKYAQALEQALAKKWGNIPRLKAAKFSWEEITKKYYKLLKNL